MNSLDALMRVSRMVGAPDAAQALAGYEPDKFAEAELMAAGRAVATFGEKSVHPSVADLGYQPILNMRHFQVSVETSRSSRAKLWPPLLSPLWRKECLLGLQHHHTSTLIVWNGLALHWVVGSWASGTRHGCDSY